MIDDCDGARLTRAAGSIRPFRAADKQERNGVR
jgi:hypothetical protein